MNNLPAEILHNIFIRLEFHDRVECTLVCRFWWQVLKELSLCDNIEMFSDSELFESFLAKMEECPHYASQVQDLGIICNIHDVDKRDLLNILPNIKVIEVSCDRHDVSPWRGLQHYSEPSEPIEMTHSKSTLKFLYDSMSCEVANQLLVSNLGLKLEEFELDFVEFDNVMARVTLNRLKNLPVLKELVIIYPILSIMDLENIHKNVPSIQEFRLRHAWIVPSEFPSDIVPASSITSFEININQARADEENHDDVAIHCQLYQYMCQKYSNLTEVEHHNEHLVCYGSDNRRHVYLNGLLDFYTRVVIPVGDKLTIGGVPDNINIFERADNVNAQFEKVDVYHSEGGTFFQYLAQSNQVNYVKSLHLHGTEIGTPVILKSLMTLTTLVLSFGGDHNSPPMNFTEYLNGTPPTLRHLLFHCPSVQVDPSNTHLSLIKTLDISCRNIGDLVGVISSSFPELVHLKFSARISIRENLHLSLHMPTFQKATFSLTGTRNGKRDGFLSFKSLDQTEYQHYRFRYGHATSVPYEEIQNAPTLTVTTLTKKRVYLSNGVQLLPI